MKNLNKVKKKKNHTIVKANKLDNPRASHVAELLALTAKTLSQD